MTCSSTSVAASPVRRRVVSSTIVRCGADGASGCAAAPCAATQRATWRGPRGAMKSSENNAWKGPFRRSACHHVRGCQAGGRAGRCVRPRGAAGGSATAAGSAAGGGLSSARSRIDGAAGDSGGGETSVSSSTTASIATSVSSGTGVSGTASTASSTGSGGAGGVGASTRAPRTAKGRLTTPTLCTWSGLMRCASGWRLCQATTWATT